MDITTAAVLFAVFMLGICVNYRQGFRRGALCGHEYGVYETISWMLASGHITGVNTETGNSLPVRAITDKVLSELAVRRPTLTYEQVEEDVK
jgi:hypothetical protein